MNKICSVCNSLIKNTIFIMAILLLLPMNSYATGGSGGAGSSTPEFGFGVISLLGMAFYFLVKKISHKS